MTTSPCLSVVVQRSASTRSRRPPRTSPWAPGSRQLFEHTWPQVPPHRVCSIRAKAACAAVSRSEPACAASSSNDAGPGRARRTLHGQGVDHLSDRDHVGAADVAVAHGAPAAEGVEEMGDIVAVGGLDRKRAA
ncbi:MAG: hypothetical protein R2715_17750 [Ilumatobacteraceae bacterium]